MREEGNGDWGLSGEEEDEEMTWECNGLPRFIPSHSEVYVLVVLVRMWVQ